MAKAKQKNTVTMEADKFGQVAAEMANQTMTTSATIKSVKIDKDGSQILMENCRLTGEQYRKLAKVVAEQTMVDVQITLIQGELPFSDGAQGNG